MRYYFSDLVKEIKQERSFAKWIEQRKTEMRSLAYENRKVIEKSCLESSVRHLESLLKIWKPFKAMMKKNNAYDIIINISREGYLSMEVTFPVTDEQIAKAHDKRKEDKKNGYWWVGFDESMHDVCKDYVKKTLGCMFDLYEQPYAYPSFRGNPNQRVTQFLKAK